MIDSALDLLDRPRAELRELLRTGHPIDPTDLDDTQYQGISLGPAWIEKLTWKKFMKTFRRDPDTRELRGWNVRIEQDRLDQPWTAMRRRSGRRKTFGPYRVGPAEPGEPGLLLRYGPPLRDPLVALRPGDPTLLLGWTYVGLGLRVPTPFYFSLTLDGPLVDD